MQRPFTEAARRALQRAAGLARLDDSPLVEPLHLLWAMVVEESRATELLGRHGVTRGTIPVHLPEVVLHDSPDIPFAEHGPEMQSVIREARTRVDRRPADEEITTEHLLWGLTAVPTPASEFLTRHGVDGSTVSMDSPGETHGEPLPVDFEIAWRSEEAGADEKETRLFDPDRNSSILSDATFIPRVSTDKKAGLLENSTLRTLDAAANRAREGLRVVEDFTRFHLNDAFLTRLLKESRHELANAVRGWEQTPGISQIPGVLSGVAMRDTPGDVGTGVSTPSESERRSPYDVAAASLKRAEEALRSLEEFGKCLSAELGGRFESLRYRLYTLEKVILTTAGSQRRLAGRRLYLLLTRELCRQDPESVVRAAVTAGVDVIQVREKTLSDRELLAWALRVRAIIEEPGVARPDERDGREDVSAASSHALRSSGRATPLQSPIPDPPSPPLLIVNDRPDIAVLCRADGVHVGQDELSAADVRRIVGPEMLVGVSTHTLAQAQQAVLDGADYLGVGPVFASRTKEFEEYAGLDFVRDVASEISLPWFAIGGIRPDNAVEAISAGAERIAVSGAICRAEDPANATAALRTVVDGQP